MKKLLYLILFLPLFASAQIPADKDTTLYSGSTAFTPQHRYKNVTLSGVNYRIPQVYNSLLGKYDTYVTSKYLRAFYAPLNGFSLDTIRTAIIYPNSVTASSTNFMMSSNGTNTRINATSNIIIGTGGSTQTLINSSVIATSLPISTPSINVNGTSITTPSSGISLFAPSANRFGFVGANGYSAALITNGFTGSHTYVLPDVSGGTFALTNTNNSFSVPQSMTGLVIYGSAGQRYINMENETVASVNTPGSAINFYGTGGNSIGWKNTGGYNAIISSSAISADRTYTLPDISTNLVGENTSIYTTSMGVTTGTATLDSARLSVTVVGSTVRVSGYIRVASVSSPSGALFIDLPYTIKNTEPSFGAAAVWANGLNALATGSIQAYGNRGTNLLVLQRYVNGSTNNLGDYVQSGTEFMINFTYTK